MYGQTEDQEKQKKKIVIVSLIMGIIIVVLIGVLISAITSKNKANQVAETSVVRDDEKSAPTATKVEANTKSEDANKSENNAEDAKLEPVTNEDKKSEKTETTVTPKSDVKTENLPKTGPESVLALALLAGSATTYVFSRKRK